MKSGLSAHFQDQFEKEKGTTLSSPNCSSILEKSIDLLSTLAGVPVLNLLTFIPFSIKDAVKLLAA